MDFGAKLFGPKGRRTMRLKEGEDDKIAESTNRLKQLLASPGDLTFKYSPNAGGMI